MKYLMVYETGDVSPELLRATYPAHRARIDEFAARGEVIISKVMCVLDAMSLGLKAEQARRTGPVK